MKIYPVYKRDLNYGFFLRVQYTCDNRPSMAREAVYEQIGTVTEKSQRRALELLSRRIKNIAPQDGEVGNFSVLLKETCARIAVKVVKSTWTGNYKVIGYIDAQNLEDALGKINKLILGSFEKER